MAAASFLTVEMIEQKLERLQYVNRKKLPIGLHAWPKCKSPNFCGIGLIDWGGDTDPPPVADVFVGEGSKLYDDINKKLRTACENLGLKFMSMA